MVRFDTWLQKDRFARKERRMSFGLQALQHMKLLSTDTSVLKNRSTEQIMEEHHLLFIPTPRTTDKHGAAHSPFVTKNSK